MIKNSLTTYGFIAKSFHWLMALLFTGMFIVAYIMINIPKSEFRFSLYDLHKATGILLFTLVGLRLAWRFFNVQPELTNIPTWQKIAAKGNIALLYLIMIIMPVSGFLTSTLGGHDISFYGIFTFAPLDHNAEYSEFFAEAHEYLSYLFIAAFSVHVLGSLYHHYFLRDGIFKKIWK